MDFRKILIAIDESPIAARAAETGMDLARALGASVGFVHVFDPAREGVPADSGVSTKEVIAMTRDDARRLFAEFQERRAGEGPAHEFLVEGHPAAEIVAAARQWPADLLVIGSHGRHGVRRALLGSVAEGVMRHASCPVLVVRGDS